MEDWLLDIPGRDIDAFTVVDVSYAASGYCIRYRFFYLLLVATDKTLPVNRAFTFAIRSAVNKVRHTTTSGFKMIYGRVDTIHTIISPVSWCSPSQSCV